MGALLDNVSTGNNNTSSSSLSWSHTLGSLGGSGLIIVGVEGETTTSNYGNSIVSGVTFNGVSMTKVVENGNNGGSNAVHVSLWELHGSNVPGAGSYTVSVSYTGATISQAAGALSFKNVLPQTAEASSSVSLNGNSSPSDSVTTLTPNALLVSIYGSQNTPVATSSTSDTEGFHSIPGTAEQSECDGFYRTVVLPASSTVTLSAANPEAEAMVTASFATAQSTFFPQL